MQNESDVFISPKDSLDIIKKILAILIYQKNKLKKILEQSKEENANENLEITGNEDNLEEREIVVLDHSDNFSKDEEIETEEIKKEELLNSFNLFPDENLKNIERKEKFSEKNEKNLLKVVASGQCMCYY